MNRQQKRKKHKPKTVTPLQLMAVKEQMTNEVVDIAKALVMTATVVVLHDEYGFGKKRIQHVVEKLENQFDCMEKGFVDIGELVKEINKEYDLDISEV